MPDEATLDAALRDHDRLEALGRTGLMDTPAEEEFDRLTRLVCRLLGVPAALVSLIGADRQFFKSAVGLPEPWMLRRETTLLHSFCQHVVASGAPLLIQDAGQHPLVSGNLAVPELGVVAYLGMPLTTADGHVLGALCAIDTEPRTWLPSDAAVLRDLATMTMSEVTLHRLVGEVSGHLRSEVVARDAAEAKARRLEAVRQLANDAAHEFAGIMQSVQSGMRLAAARLRDDPATAQSILALVGDVARRGGALTERLLTFTPRTELRPERVNVEALLQRVAKMLSGASQSALRTFVEADPDLPPVLADAEELRAVLLFFVRQARSAMPEGGILRLGAALDETTEDQAHVARLSPGCYIRLSITDTGTGVAAEEPATRLGAPSTVSATGSNTAFEFALAREFIDQLGGCMTRESRPGAGTTVTLWLPQAKTDHARHAGPSG